MLLRTVLFLILGEHLQKNNSPFTLIKGFFSREMLKYFSFWCKKSTFFYVHKIREKLSLEETSAGCLVQPSCLRSVNDSRLIRTMSWQVFNIFRDSTPYPLRASCFSIPSDSEQKIFFKNYVLTVPPASPTLPPECPAPAVALRVCSPGWCHLVPVVNQGLATHVLWSWSPTQSSAWTSTCKLSCTRCAPQHQLCLLCSSQHIFMHID